MNRRDTADFDVADEVACTAARFQADRVATGGQAGEHLLQRQAAQQLGRAEQVIGRDRQLTRTVDCPHHRHPTATKVTDPGPDPCRTALRALSCRPLGPAKASTSASITWPITCNPVATASDSSPSAICPVNSPNATVTCSGTLTFGVAVSPDGLL